MKIKSIFSLLLIAIIIVTILEVTLYSEKAGKSSDPDTLIVKFDTTVANFMKESGAPGVAIAIIKEGEIVYTKCYGVREVGKPGKIDQNTVFRIASLSKGFASVLTGILVENGYFQWNDPVIKYLPDFTLSKSSSTQDLTIRNILSHTSGLVHHAYDNLLDANIPFKKIIPNLKVVPIFAPVGEYYSYQNVLFSLIDPIINKVTGERYQDILRDSLIIPLCMINTSFDRKSIVEDSNHAVPHIKRRGKWTPISIKGTYYSVTPAAGLNSSVHDMVLWLAALVGERQDIINTNVIDEVCKPVVKTPYIKWRYNWKRKLKDAHYGMGWRIFDFEGHKFVYHSGGVRGYLAKIGFLPEYRTGIVVLMNSYFKNRFVFSFIDMYLHTKPEKISLKL